MNIGGSTTTNIVTRLNPNLNAVQINDSFYNNKLRFTVAADNSNSGGCNTNVAVKNYHWKNTF